MHGEYFRGPRAEELCASRGGRSGLPVPNSPYGLCGRKATLSLEEGSSGVGPTACPGDDRDKSLQLTKPF